MACLRRTPGLRETHFEKFRTVRSIHWSVKQITKSLTIRFDVPTRVNIQKADFWGMKSSGNLKTAVSIWDSPLAGCCEHKTGLFVSIRNTFEQLSNCQLHGQCSRKCFPDAGAGIVRIIGTATGLQVARCGIRISVAQRDFSLLRNFQTVSGAHTASYSMGTVILSRVKMARAWSWPLTSI